MESHFAKFNALQSYLLYGMITLATYNIMWEPLVH